jgi:hypothetical protein
MSIKSNAFGRVVLTDVDAVKFRNQVTYGRPKAAAKRNVVEGVKLSRALAKDGSLRVELKEPA